MRTARALLLMFLCWLPARAATDYAIDLAETKSGRLLCHNAFTHRLVYPDLYMAFVPDDDDESRVEIYRV